MPHETQERDVNGTSFSLLLYVVCLIGLAFLGAYVSDTYMQTNFLTKTLWASGGHRFETDMAYVDLPRVMVNVNSESDSMQVQLDVALEVEKKDAVIVEGYKPKLSENMYDFMSHLRATQVRSDRFTSWLRAELLDRMNHVGLPVPVHSVVLQRLLVT